MLLATLAALAVPGWVIAPAISLVAAGLLRLGKRAADRRVEASAWALGLAALGALGVAPIQDFVRALGATARIDAPIKAVRWAVPVLVAALLAWHRRVAEAARVAQPIAVVLAYVAAAQIVAGPLLSAVPAVMLATAALLRRTMPALLAAAALAAA